ncbi:MAG TPA: AtzH-like domain-containing protein [Pilimelia sp.]|nr:AtzH-like domain-containing protein [Pilimelia sp.]
MEINNPGVVAEVAAAFADYEAALVAGDAERTAGWFWESPEVVRFGVADRQLGAVEHRRWRLSQPPLPPGRRLAGTRISTFGADYAVVTTLFAYDSTATQGRQSQTWARLPDGWRIVTAHVSALPTA